MQPSSDRPATEQTTRALRRWGPLGALVLIVALVGTALVLTKSSKHTGASPGPTTTPGTAGGPGAISFSAAKAQGLKETFPAGCDLKTGRAAIPYFFAPACYANVADNGGATAPGVTATSIKVVLYQAQQNDPVLSFILAAIKSKDTNAQAEATYRGYIKMFESFAQTYGRKVDLQVVQASGTALDEVAARADAVKVADMHPFAVWGGPALLQAWADELAARHVICLSCVGGDAPDWYTKRAPYVYTVLPNPEQASLMTAEYIGKKVAGHPAAHAGDPALALQPRKFGLLYLDTSPTSKTQADEFAATLKTKYGVDIAQSVGYVLDPAKLQEEADSAIAKLKSAGVTSVIFSGDPVAPATFTAQATAQKWFPEWVLGAGVLVDNSAFARTYDQRQWAHAFGIAIDGTVPRPREQSGSYFLYRWFTGQAPPAVDTSGVLLPQPSIFYGALQAAGPTLTAENFRAGAFTIAPGAAAETGPAFSYGRHGLWPYDDYNGVDDATEVWWDPAAAGRDELDRQGNGLYQYVDGGRRYLSGQWPKGDTKAFDPAGAVTVYTRPPPNEVVPDYPSPAKPPSGQ